MILGFKRRFVSLVRDGSKQHTIRAMGKILRRVGMMCDCYADPRQKTMKLIGRWKCTKIQDILIAGTGYPDSTYVQIDGIMLQEDERESLAWADGFRGDEPFDEMLTFWRTEHPVVKGEPFYFRGQIIHWRWDKKGVAK